MTGVAVGVGVIVGVGVSVGVDVGVEVGVRVGVAVGVEVCVGVDVFVGVGVGVASIAWIGPHPDAPSARKKNIKPPSIRDNGVRFIQRVALWNRNWIVEEKRNIRM
jgi:hypothetical protein